jgi:segregation and condensation protein B
VTDAPKIPSFPSDGAASADSPHEENRGESMHAQRTGDPVDEAPHVVGAEADKGMTVEDAAQGTMVGGPAVVESDADAHGAFLPFVVEEWVFAAVEALCFVSGEPVTPARVRDVLAAELPSMEGKAGVAPPTLHQVKSIFSELLRRFADPTRVVGQGFRLVEVDGGLAFRTASSQARFVRRMQMGKPQKLSRAALETLAVIAYRQPVTKPQIEDIRGVDCGGALKALLDKKLVRVLGKAEDVGRPLLYGTSKMFLEFFQLQSLNDLPTLKELHDIEGGDPRAAAGDDDAAPAVVMDLFAQDGQPLVSAETEEESADALDALERALGEAKKVAKTASSLVLGIEVTDDEGTPPNES